MLIDIKMIKRSLIESAHAIVSTCMHQFQNSLAVVFPYE